MNRSERISLLIVVLLLCFGALLWMIYSRHKRHTETVIPVPPPPLVSISTAAIEAPRPVSPPKKPPTRVLPPTARTGAPTPPAIKLHKELIPKDIAIVRCYYVQEIAPPGVTIEFDINGSGFTAEFEKMIKVESGTPHIRVKNLHLVTANQIHGEMEIDSRAETQFVYPRVLIKGLPVFSAQEPFAIVRKGEVLAVFFISMEETGRAGRFRVITHLDEKLVKQFRVEPSTAGIEISDLTAQLPYAMEGRLNIAPGVPQGEYGLAIRIAGKEVFRRIGMIRIVRPNVGQTGFIQGAMSAERFHRPGDTIHIYLQGTGLTPQDTLALEAKVDEFTMGRGSFTFLSPVQMRVAFESPKTTPLGSYSVSFLDHSGKTLFQKKDLFKIIGADWVAGVQVSPPVHAGGKSLLKVIGRDFSEDFVNNFRFETDDPGITISGLARTDASTLSAEIAVSSGVAPGDYWLHLSSKGKKIDPPFGSIIKVESAP